MSQPPPISDDRTDDALELAPVHDFVRKLMQPDFHERVQAYVSWQQAVRAAKILEINRDLVG